MDINKTLLLHLSFIKFSDLFSGIIMNKTVNLFDRGNETLDGESVSIISRQHRKM
jgi:hypothetical protein